MEKNKPVTDFLFSLIFIVIYGFAIGKTFKKLNPFLMLLGMIFTLPIVVKIHEHDNALLYIPFFIGFFSNFGNPFRKIIDAFSEIRYNILGSLQRNRQERYDREQAQQAYQDNSEELYRQKEDIEAELKRQKKVAQEEINRQEQQAKENLKRAAEKLQREKEQFYREQVKAQQGNNQSSTQNNDLNPNNFSDACEILGCKSTDDFATLKKAYRVLRAMYHPDKIEQFGGRRKQQAQAEMKLINQAWERVNKKFK